MSKYLNILKFEGVAIQNIYVYTTLLLYLTSSAAASVAFFNYYTHKMFLVACILFPCCVYLYWYTLVQVRILFMNTYKATFNNTAFTIYIYI